MERHCPVQRMHSYKLRGQAVRFLWAKKGLLTGTVLGLFVAMAWSQAGAQQTSVPSLHQRSEAEPGSTGSSSSSSGQQSMLPGDVSGYYQFDEINESIRIDIVHNKLTGYISRLGDAETDSSTPVTYSFDQSSVDGSQIRFQTRVVHGVWYSFRGTIRRGDAEIRDEEGYYVLHGNLETHHPQSGFDKSANETIERRMVNFKSMPSGFLDGPK